MLMKRILVSIVLTALAVICAAEAFSADVEIIAYYFHGNIRCFTCYTMEEYIKEAIQENFKDELADGLLIFKAVNVEEKEHKHFLDDYQLYTKALIISRVEDGKEVRYKNLTKIWEYVRDKEKFFSYVTDEINDYLKDPR